jgi:Rnl2 family RNA ligase
LDEALNFNPEFDSKILGIADNICEGIVIKPTKNYQSPNGELFWIKKKNDKFKEIQKAPKIPKPPQARTKVDDTHDVFLGYITDNRLQNVFSKYGMIPDKTKIGDYIKYLIEDARLDFEKDIDLSEFNVDDLRMIYGIRSLGFELLKKYL